MLPGFDGRMESVPYAWVEPRASLRLDAGPVFGGWGVLAIEAFVSGLFDGDRGLERPAAGREVALPGHPLDALEERAVP